MIAEECARLREQLEELKEANERRKVVAQLDGRRQDLVDLRNEVLDVSNSLNAISSRVSLEGEVDVAKALTRVKGIREALENDPLSITKGRDFANMKKAFEKFSQDGSAIAADTWENYLARGAQPKVDANQLAQAKQQKDFKATVVRLEARETYAKKIAKSPPGNEEEFKEIEDAWEDIRQLISELPELASDPTVQKFLEAANSRDGATLDLLTDEVRDWLEENSISINYRVTTM